LFFRPWEAEICLQERDRRLAVDRGWRCQRSNPQQPTRGSPNRDRFATPRARFAAFGLIQVTTAQRSGCTGTLRKRTTCLPPGIDPPPHAEDQDTRGSCNSPKFNIGLAHVLIEALRHLGNQAVASAPRLPVASRWQNLVDNNRRRAYPGHRGLISPRSPHRFN
jgi:hypothetical protein